MIPSNHDSHEIRASILDVCIQLGVLDSNSPVADWMFSDSAPSNRQSEERKRHGSRFHERVSPSIQWEEMAPALHVKERRTPLSIVRFKPTSKAKSKPNTDSHHPETTSNERQARRETRFSSLRSFLRRASAQRPEYNYHEINKDAYSGQASTNSRSLLQSEHHSGAVHLTVPSVHGSSSPMPRSPSWEGSSYEPQPIATPPVNLLDDPCYSSDSHSDDDWEKIELRPQSFLYALQHQNNLPPPRRLKKKQRRASTEQYERGESITSRKAHRSFSFAIPRPNTSKSTRSTLRPLAVYGTQFHHSDANAQSPSPVVLVTPADTPPPTPLTATAFESPREPQLVHRPSMGYHNQFFVRANPQLVTQKLLPSLPPSPLSTSRGHQVSAGPRIRHPTPPL